MTQPLSPSADGIRVHVALARAGVASRRKLETWIGEGRITVNGQLAQIGQRVMPNDSIRIDNKPVEWAAPKEAVYYLVNKPRGYVSTTSDELGRRNVTDLVPNTTDRLYPVGRLDMDSEGLLLLTNDGDLAYRFTHPKFHIQKTYHALVAGKPTPQAIGFLRKSVKLREGWVTADSVKVLESEDRGTWMEIVIHEGKYHQVRRMLERAGYDTLRLIRMTMGPFTLDMLGDKPFMQLSGDDVQNALKNDPPA